MSAKAFALVDHVSEMERLFILAAPWFAGRPEEYHRLLRTFAAWRGSGARAKPNKNGGSAPGAPVRSRNALWRYLGSDLGSSGIMRSARERDLLLAPPGTAQYSRSPAIACIAVIQSRVRAVSSALAPKAILRRTVPQIIDVPEWTHGPARMMLDAGAQSGRSRTRRANLAEYFAVRPRRLLPLADIRQHEPRANHVA